MAFSLKDIFAKTRNFLFSSVNKQFLVFAFFLVLSSIFWLLMTMNETYQQELLVELKLSDVPENVVLTGNLPDTVRVTVSDKGYTLIAYTTTHKLTPVWFSFNTVANTRTGKGSISASEVTRLIAKQLYSSTQIVSLKPEKFDFSFNYGQSKSVPIELKGAVVPNDNYYLSQTLFYPSTVTVYGNEELLDTLRSVTTEVLDVRNFEDTLTVEARLEPIEGAKLVPQKVRVKFFADILTEETVEVPIQAVNMPPGKTLRTFPNKVSITYQVGASKVRSISSKSFYVVADYKDIEGQPSEKCPIKLKSYPSSVSRPKLSFNQVEYVLEQ